MFNIKNLFGRSCRKLPDQTEAILGRHLYVDFTIFPMAERQAATATLVNEIGRAHGVQYPADFVSHVCGQFPGVYIQAKESVWPRPKLHDVGPFWSFLYALHTYTAASESEPWMRLDEAAKTFQDETGLIAAPILTIVGDADLYCSTPDGSIARFRHEEGELEPIELSFWELFEQEVQQLAERKARKLAGT